MRHPRTFTFRYDPVYNEYRGDYEYRGDGELHRVPLLWRILGAPAPWEGMAYLTFEAHDLHTTLALIRYTPHPEEPE